jgi:hypothetical protein
MLAMSINKIDVTLPLEDPIKVDCPLPLPVVKVCVTSSLDVRFEVAGDTSIDAFSASCICVSNSMSCLSSSWMKLLGWTLPDRPSVYSQIDPEF